MEFTKETAKKLLEEHVKDDYQKLHASMVATALEAYAKKLGEDENLWYTTGLLHDIDYFEFPDAHPNESLKWFKEWGFPLELITAVAEHAFDRTRVEIQTKLGAALTACDEMSGFLYAYSLMRPEGFEGMEASSVKKKFKDKAFARKVSREDINIGIEKFGVDFKEHVSFLVEVFKK